MAEVPLGKIDRCCAIAVRLGIADAYELLPASVSCNERLAEDEVMEDLDKRIDLVRRTLALALGELPISEFANPAGNVNQTHANQSSGSSRLDGLNDDSVEGHDVQKCRDSSKEDDTFKSNELGVSVDFRNSWIYPNDKPSDMAVRLRNAALQWGLFLLLYEAFPSGLNSGEINKELYGDAWDGSTDKLNNVHKELNEKLRLVGLTAKKSSDKSAVWKLASTR